MCSSVVDCLSSLETGWGRGEEKGDGGRVGE